MPTVANLKPSREPETGRWIYPWLCRASTKPRRCRNASQRSSRCFTDTESRGEIIVADNGSTDGSSDIATRMGARVVRVKDKGYGNALRGGTARARGKYVITVDADNSHDLAEIPTFLSKLQSGYDLVIGSRFSGGIQPGAMPRLHPYLGSRF